MVSLFRGSGRFLSTYRLCLILSVCFLYVSDQGSTYSGDLESEAVSTPHSWEEELNHYALKSNAVQEADSDLKQLSKGETEQDLEADFPSGLCNIKYSRF